MNELFLKLDGRVTRVYTNTVYNVMPLNYCIPMMMRDGMQFSTNLSTQRQSQSTIRCIITNIKNYLICQWFPDFSVFPKLKVHVMRN